MTYGAYITITLRLFSIRKLDLLPEHFLKQIVFKNQETNVQSTRATMTQHDIMIFGKVPIGFLFRIMLFLI